MAIISETFRTKVDDNNFSEDTYFATRTDYVYLYGENGQKVQSLKKKLINIEDDITAVQNEIGSVKDYLGIDSTETSDVKSDVEKLKVFPNNLATYLELTMDEFYNISDSEQQPNRIVVLEKTVEGLQGQINELTTRIEELEKAEFQVQINGLIARIEELESAEA